MGSGSERTVGGRGCLTGPEEAAAVRSPKGGKQARLGAPIERLEEGAIGQFWGDLDRLLELVPIDVEPMVPVEPALQDGDPVCQQLACLASQRCKAHIYEDCGLASCDRGPEGRRQARDEEDQIGLGKDLFEG